MAGEGESTAAQAAWRIHLIRTTICESAAPSLLVTIAQLDKLSFQTAVQYIWGAPDISVFDVERHGSRAIEERLAAVKSADRYMMYSQAIRQMTLYSSDHSSGLAPFLLRYPGLRVVLAAGGMRDHICIRHDLSGNIQRVECLFWTSSHFEQHNYDTVGTHCRTLVPSVYPIDILLCFNLCSAAGLVKCLRAVKEHGFKLEKVFLSLDVIGLSVRDSAVQDKLVLLADYVHGRVVDVMYDNFPDGGMCYTVDMMGPLIDRALAVFGPDKIAKIAECHSKKPRPIGDIVHVLQYWLHRHDTLRRLRGLDASIRWPSRTEQQELINTDIPSFKTVPNIGWPACSADGLISLVRFTSVPDYSSATDSEIARFLHAASTWMRSLARAWLYIAGPAGRRAVKSGFRHCFTLG